MSTYAVNPLLSHYPSFPVSDFPGPAGAGDWLATLARAHLGGWARSALYTPSIRSELCRASRLHPNGFVKLTLGSSRDERVALRLHIWPPGVEDSSIHTHRWSFTSLIVCGTLEESIFSPEPGATYTLTECQSDPSGQIRSQAIAPVGLKFVRTAVRIASDHYTCPPDRFHSVRNPTSSYAYTLFVRYGVVSDSAFYCSPQGQCLEVDSTKQMEALTEDRLVAFIGALSEHCSP